MLDKIWKRISGKRPKGAKLIKIVAIISGVVWLSAIAIVFGLKGKSAKADIHSRGGAKVASVQGEAGAIDGDAAAGDQPPGAAFDQEAEPSSDEGDEDQSRTEVADPRAKALDNQAKGDAKSTAHGGVEGAEAEARDGRGAGSQGIAGGADEEEAENVSAELPPSPEEFAALRQVADLFVATGDIKKAVTPMRRVLRVPTRDIALLSTATDVFLSTGNYREGLGTAQQLLALKPDDIRVKVQLVEAQYRLGKVEKAFAAAHALLKDHPGELTMLTTLGTMEVEMGPSHPDYGKSLKTALKLKPDYAPALYQQGRKAQLEGDYKDAETAFRKVLRLEPQNAKAHGQLGMALYHLGKEKDAEKEYRAELAMNREDYNTWYNLGELQLSYASREMLPSVIQGLRTEAMESFLKALELNPDLAQAHYRVGVLLNGNGQYKEAIRHLEASLKADSHHVPTLVQLSLAFENLKQPERARAYLTKAYELDPLNKVVLFKLKQWS